MKLKEIKKYVLSNILIDKYDKGNIYDDDGHCGKILYRQILEFWSKLDNDNFKYLISAKWASDDLDLNGGRSHFLSDDELLNMIANYIIYELKWTLDDYNRCIINTTEFTEEIVHTMSDILSANMIGGFKETNIWKSYNFNQTKDDELNKVKDEEIDSSELTLEFIPKIIKYNNSLKSKIDKFKNLKFIGNVSDGIIYEIIEYGSFIPKGYEII